MVGRRPSRGRRWKNEKGGGPVFTIRSDQSVLLLGRACLIAACLALFAGAAPTVRADEKAPAPEDKLKKLLQARLEAAQKVCDVRVAEYQAGRVAFESVAAAEKQLLTAQLELSDKKEDRVAACEKNLEFCTEIKKMAAARLKAGQGSPADDLQAECERLEAEILLEREKAK